MQVAEAAAVPPSAHGERVHDDVIVGVTLAGVSTGVRSTVAFAHLVRHGLLARVLPADLAPSAQRWAPPLLTLAAAGELVADKAIDLPSRTELAPLAGRAGIGALIGVLAARLNGGSAAAGALIGGAAAIAAAVIATRLRATLARRGVPDAATALCEDALVVALSREASDRLGLTGTTT